MAEIIEKKLIFECTVVGMGKSTIFRVETLEWHGVLFKYVVKFYNHKGTHMDASDMETESLPRALRWAIPSDENLIVKWYDK